MAHAAQRAVQRRRFRFPRNRSATNKIKCAGGPAVPTTLAALAVAFSSSLLVSIGLWFLVNGPGPKRAKAAGPARGWALQRIQPRFEPGPFAPRLMAPVSSSYLPTLPL